MGYTHYWRRPKSLNAAKWLLAVEDCKKICDSLAIPLANGMGEQGSKPTFGKEVMFNGADGDDYETFHVPRVFKPDSWQTADESGKWFAFCKTAHRPYDMAVMCCLIVFKHHFGSKFVVSSDGDASDWEPAQTKCAEVLGYGDQPQADDNSDHVIVRGSRFYTEAHGE